MRTLFIYADFDWLDAPVLMGELGYESLRGADSYSFKFDNDWLRHYGSLFLSADINNYPGLQYTQPNKDIFGCFSDALPDRWGRLLRPPSVLFRLPLRHRRFFAHGRLPF